MICMADYKRKPIIHVQETCGGMLDNTLINLYQGFQFIKINACIAYKNYI